MTAGTSPSDGSNRSDVLHRIAKACKRQGSYQLAAKKFAEAGERLKSMKALIKARDTEKIIFFAGEVSKAPKSDNRGSIHG